MHPENGGNAEMTLDEFRALKKGDRIRNAMSNSAGVVIAANEFRNNHVVVSIQWDGTTMPTAFNNVSTAWMHWSKE